MNAKNNPKGRYESILVYFIVFGIVIILVAFGVLPESILKIFNQSNTQHSLSQSEKEQIFKKIEIVNDTIDQRNINDEPSIKNQEDVSWNIFFQKALLIINKKLSLKERRILAKLIVIIAARKLSLTERNQFVQILQNAQEKATEIERRRINLFSLFLLDDPPTREQQQELLYFFEIDKGSIPRLYDSIKSKKMEYQLAFTAGRICGQYLSNIDTERFAELLNKFAVNGRLVNAEKEELKRLLSKSKKFGSVYERDIIDKFIELVLK